MLYLVKKDCKELFGNKKRIFIITAVLIILIISTYYNVSNQKVEPDHRIRFGLADEDGSVYSKMLIEYFKNSESFASRIRIMEGGDKELEQSFYKGELDLYLQIPRGFAENMIYMEHLPVKVLISTKDVTKAVLLKNILESYEKYIRAVEVNCAAFYNVMEKAGMETDFINKKNIEISYDLIFTALGKEKFFRYLDISEFPVTTLPNYYYIAFISIFLNFMGLYAGFQIMKEKKAGICKRLYTAGTPVFAFLGEKILFGTCFVFFFISLAYLFPNLYYGNRLSAEFAAVLFLASLFCTCLSVFLSGFAYKIRDYMIAGNFLCFLFAIIGGGIIPVMYLPGAMAKLAVFTPNYWLIRVLLSIQKEMGEGLVFKYSSLLLSGSLLFLLLAVYLYRREEVYYED